LNEELKDSIRSNFNLLDTYQLLEIWKTNDRVEWSDTAFEILRGILRERIGNAPSQDNPILEYQKESEINKKDHSWEEKLLDDDNQPELYDTLQVLDLLGKINKVAIAVVIINILLGLGNFQAARLLLGGFSTQDLKISSGDVIYFIFDTTIKTVVTYFPLKALAQILRILMEMEFNSRKATS